jgi:hypothetical protein
VGGAGAVSGQLDALQGLVDGLRHLRLRQALLAQAVADVLRHCQVRKDGVALEHHVGRPLVGRHGRHGLAVDEDLALGRELEAGEHAQQGGLAAAGGTEQREEFAAPDLERDIVDGAHRTEVLGDAAQGDEGVFVACHDCSECRWL